MSRKLLCLLLVGVAFLFPSFSHAGKGGAGKSASIPSLRISLSSDTQSIVLTPELPKGANFAFLDSTPVSDGSATAPLLYFVDGKPVRITYKVSTSVPLVPNPTPDPNPTPTPDPTPQPKPDAKYQVVFINETGDLDNLPQGQRDMLGSLIFRQGLKKKGHIYIGNFDKGMVGPDGKVPEAYAGWWQSVEGLTLPRVCIAPLDAKTSEDIITFELPKTEAEFWKTLENGGKP